LHLSRLAEEIILWSSGEFGFVELDDAYATGSSIMPQKKNPDVAELARGKTGRVFGSLIALLTVMKGLPLAYNKDMQEDKEQVFDAVDTVGATLSVFSQMLATMTVNGGAMKNSAAGGFTNATDAADYLVKKGLPFRDAHKIIGEMVAYCVKEDKPIGALSLQEFQQFSGLFGEDIFEAVSLEACVNLRDVPGGTARQRVRAAIENARKQAEASSDAR
ncbi:MAG: argininosuccinate lyase, partial [Clostridiales bacterium]|nr:argininosuccinate lyase [Clostridiales bacterium]